jgi:hypothetical protein
LPLGVQQPVAPVTVPSTPQREKFSIWIPVKLAVVPIVGLIMTALEERSAPRGEAIGYFIGVMLLPTLIALIVVGFKPARKMRTLSTVFCCVGLAGFGGVLLSTSVRPFEQQKTPQDLMREAAGTKPKTEPANSSESEVDTLLREFMSDTLAARKKHDADASPLAPALTTLYTAQSFSSAKHMEDAVAAVNKVLQIDGEFADKFQRMPQDLKARVDASGLTPTDKEDVMIGFQKGYGGSEILKAYSDVRTLEEQWAAATIELYSFARQHSSAIKTADNKILISDPGLLNQFNEKLKHSRERRRNLDEANQRLAGIQAAALQKTGLSKSDLGLK